MRIMIISDACPIKQVNGVVVTLQNTIAELQGLGHPVDFVTPNDFRTVTYPPYPEIELAVFPRKILKKRIINFLRYPGPHAFHVATESMLGLSATRILTKLDLRFTTSFHTDFAAYAQGQYGIPEDITWRYLRWFHNRADRILVATRTMEDELTERKFNNLGRWGRGVNQETFHYGPATNKQMFLYGGRVSKEKNIEDFLSLYLPNSVVAGDGPYKEYLENKYPHAKFMGKVSQEEMANLMRQASVFVFPSKTDTFGLVMAEAMCCGTPVAAYPVQGPLDVVVSGETGVLHNDLRTAVDQCLKLDRSAISKLATEQFSWKTCTTQMLSHLITA